MTAEAYLRLADFRADGTGKDCVAIVGYLSSRFFLSFMFHFGSFHSVFLKFPGRL